MAALLRDVSILCPLITKFDFGGKHGNEDYLDLWGLPENVCCKKDMMKHIYNEMSCLQDKPHFFPWSNVRLCLVVKMWKSLLILKGVKPFYWNAGRVEIEKTTSIKLEHLTSLKVVTDMTISHISGAFISLKAPFIWFLVDKISLLLLEYE